MNSGEGNSDRPPVDAEETVRTCKIYLARAGEWRWRLLINDSYVVAESDESHVSGYAARQNFLQFVAAWWAISDIAQIAIQFCLTGGGAGPLMSIHVVQDVTDGVED
ncbi:MAG TPA: hypothetical protein VM219_09110 [Phycisphaerae bacterium]|nr:hypothetical protein [Phycisphaerae bacterium]HUX02974.1 hypothetical protein [Phycisphaerae bacterium]